VMHGVHLAAQIHGSQLVLVPGMAHRFQERFKAPLLAAVLPYIANHQLPVAGPQLALLPAKNAEYVR
jgi:hypothetical protein